MFRIQVLITLKIINTIKREGVLKNLPMKFVWTLSLNLNIFLILPYIFVTIS